MTIKTTTKAETLALWEALSMYVENLNDTLELETVTTEREELQDKMLAAQSILSTIDAHMAEVGLEGFEG